MRSIGISGRRSGRRFWPAVRHFNRLNKMKLTFSRVNYLLTKFFFLDSSAGTHYPETQYKIKADDFRHVSVCM